VTASPDRALARVVLVALALGGLLGLVPLMLLTLGAGTLRSGVRTLRCFFEPISSIDTVVHASAIATASLAGLAFLAGMRLISRERATVAELRGATMTARLHSVPARLVAVGIHLGVNGRVDVVDAPRPFAFVYGWIWPRICISTGLLDRLTDRELEAVLHHEGWHAARRDPLRLLIVRSIGATFAFVPPISRLVRLYLLTTEVAADRHAVAMMGHSQWLASALVKSVSPPVITPAFEGHTEARIGVLAGESLPVLSWHGRIAAIVLTLEVVALVPLLLDGSIPLLANLWLHPIC